MEGWSSPALLLSRSGPSSIVIQVGPAEVNSNIILLFFWKKKRKIFSGMVQRHIPRPRRWCWWASPFVMWFPESSFGFLVFSVVVVRVVGALICVAGPYPGGWAWCILQDAWARRSRLRALRWIVNCREKGGCLWNGSQLWRGQKLLKRACGLCAGF